MDLTTVYCNLDDFYRNFNVEAPHDLLLGPRHLRQRCTSLSPSKLITILVMSINLKATATSRDTIPNRSSGAGIASSPVPPATLVWFSFFLGSFGPWFTTWEVAVVK